MFLKILASRRLDFRGTGHLWNSTINHALIETEYDYAVPWALDLEKTRADGGSVHA